MAVPAVPQQCCAEEAAAEVSFAALPDDIIGGHLMPLLDWCAPQPDGGKTHHPPLTSPFHRPSPRTRSISLARCACVCASWRQAAADDALWAAQLALELGVPRPPGAQRCAPLFQIAMQVLRQPRRGPLAAAAHKR
jgi:hypothetical protein